MERLIVKRQITYSCIFPNGNDKLEELIKIIPSKSAIAWLSYLLLKKDLETKDQNELQFLIPLLSNMNVKLQREISNYLQFISKEINDYLFIDKTAILILIEYILENHNDNDVQVLESKDDFSNLFIAYLICCYERIKYLSQDLLTIKDAESQVLHHLTEQLKINDIVYPKDYRVEFIRFYYFMIFCEEDPDFREYLKIFLQEYKIEKWKDYLYFVFSTYLRNVTNEEGASNLIQVDPYKYFGKKFLDLMSIDVKNFERKRDFTALRSKPVYYHGNNLYNIISFKFFIDKMYQGLLFDFSSILKNIGDKKVADYPKLKQLVGERFTEDYLFYEIMQGCFSKKYKKLISGKVLKEHLGEGEPDFYFRKGKNIFLFEFKDVMLNGGIKHSGDLGQIKSDFFQNYELATIEKSNGKIKSKAKGITQLLNVVENYLNKIIQGLDKIEIIDKLNIYPIIVYTDPCFDIEGFNYWLCNRFEELKQHRVIPNNYLVKECVMIPLEVLVKLEDYFNDGRLQLDDLIDDFLVECKKSEQNKLLPFNKYVMRQARLKGYNEKMSSRFKRIFDIIFIKEKS